MFESLVIFYLIYEFIIFLHKMMRFYGFFHLVADIWIELNNLMKNPFGKIEAT